MGSVPFCVGRNNPFQFSLFLLCARQIPLVKFHSPKSTLHSSFTTSLLVGSFPFHGYHTRKNSLFILCSPFSVRYPLFAILRSLSSVRQSPFAILCSLSSVRHSPFGFHFIRSVFLQSSSFICQTSNITFHVFFRLKTKHSFPSHARFRVS